MELNVWHVTSDELLAAPQTSLGLEIEVYCIYIYFFAVFLYVCICINVSLYLEEVIVES